MSASPNRRCPLCERPLYGWVVLNEPEERTVDRCESCGVAVVGAGKVDLGRELEAISSSEGDELRIECPNRASVQGSLGQAAWAPLGSLPGQLALTPAALELLAGRNGYRLEPASFPPTGRNFGWMWQTLINAFTFSNNLATDAVLRRTHPARGRTRLARAIDGLVSVLAAPVVALISLPLEAVAAFAGRGGRIVATAKRSH